MSKSLVGSAIRLRGVRHNNLKNFDLDLPLNRLIVVTGLSGSGKSSLAFDTLFAEGQRRYIETFSPYARQFFDRMDKPQVDSIEGIPPAIAIEQRNAVRTTRSTVGTMTEICDYMRMLWQHVAQLHCRKCGQLVRKDSPQTIWEASARGVTDDTTDLMITFDLPLSEKLSLQDSLGLIAKQGYQRLLVQGQITRIDEVFAQEAQGKPGKKRAGSGAGKTNEQSPAQLTVIQDRVPIRAQSRARFIEACEHAYHFGKGKLTVHKISKRADKKDEVQTAQRFSNRLHCAECDIEYREPSPALFSFNNPVGACPSCRGFGRIISIDYSLAVPDRSRTLAQGVVKPWLSGMSAECQRDLLRMCRHFKVPVDVPFEKLAKKWQDFVIEGEPGYGKDEEHEWPRAWYGLKGYFRWLESKSYKMHVRVLLSRYRAYTPCPDCGGRRFQPEALLYRAPEGLTLADFYRLPIQDAWKFINMLSEKYDRKANDPLGLALNEVRSRLGYLNEVGLGYLTLDRPTRSLSGGETERVNLTTCLGSRLVNTLFVLDEPSVGLHPRDTERLVTILEKLREAGNTVLVVEHEPGVMRAADEIVDLGPGHGATGGQVVFQGKYSEILQSAESLTGQYLSGRKQIELQRRRPVRRNDEGNLGARHQRSSEPLLLNEAAAPFGTRADTCARLKLSGANCHNLKDLGVEIPLGRFVCITGVSGSGKTTLVRDVLLPKLGEQLKGGLPETKASDRLGENGEENESESASPKGDSARLEGWEHLGAVVLVDQAILGKTPRSNPAVYIGAFDDIRELYAQSEAAKQRGLNASAFSFNSGQGQCERCRGAGFEKIEMQFLSDVFIRCPDCQGRRYRPHILQIRLSQPGPKLNPETAPRKSFATRGASKRTRTTAALPGLSIADLLESTIEEAIEFLSGFPDSRPAVRAMTSLKLLEEVGLGYLKLGQPINTLSGGESQRLKLVKHLAEAMGSVSEKKAPAVARGDARFMGRNISPVSDPGARPTLFLFDEPTTGLHFDDVRVLLRALQKLVDAGHSVVVIEHNLEVIKCADWIIDLGPDAGDEGGRVVAEGTPEEIAECGESHTGQALRRNESKIETRYAAKGR